MQSVLINVLLMWAFEH